MQIVAKLVKTFAIGRIYGLAESLDDFRYELKSTVSREGDKPGYENKGPRIEIHDMRPKSGKPFGRRFLRCEVLITADRNRQDATGDIDIPVQSLSMFR